MRSTAIYFILFALGCSVGKAADIGAIDQKEPPAKKELVCEKSSEGVENVAMGAKQEAARRPRVKRETSTS